MGPSNILVVLHPVVEVFILRDVKYIFTCHLGNCTPQSWRWFQLHHCRESAYQRSPWLAQSRSQSWQCSRSHWNKCCDNWLLSSNNTNTSAQEWRARAFAIVGNRSVVGPYCFELLIVTLISTILTMDVMVFKRVSKLRDSLNGVVVRHCVWSCPEGAIVPMHRDHGGNYWEDPDN